VKSEVLEPYRQSVPQATYTLWSKVTGHSDVTKTGYVRINAAMRCVRANIVAVEKQ